jgi:hypothetical protein
MATSCNCRKLPVAGRPGVFLNCYVWFAAEAVLNKAACRRLQIFQDAVEVRQANLPPLMTFTYCLSSVQARNAGAIFPLMMALAISSDALCCCAFDALPRATACLSILLACKFNEI